MQEKERMNKVNKIDGLIGAQNIGFLIDQHNQQIRDEMLKDHDRNINDRNDYYWKLAQRAFREINGEHVGRETFTISTPKLVKNTS